ncbi:hypothetical protein MgSA37_00468 [Mucilaginibacter gotjawali]|uniref:Uncharacterized protein n=1 Tax=Mucilaginibacter gotjawali TaxID=1550579 RepID=A0A110B064_9SPHI|nr:hypothetical protein MgSA37_00468 [Mucilaginibacter gotjawali]
MIENGNSSTSEIASLLLKYTEDINDFLKIANSGYLKSIYKFRLDKGTSTRLISPII